MTFFLQEHLHQRNATSVATLSIIAVCNKCRKKNYYAKVYELKAPTVASIFSPSLCEIAASGPDSVEQASLMSLLRDKCWLHSLNRTFWQLYKQLKAWPNTLNFIFIHQHKKYLSPLAPSRPMLLVTATRMSILLWMNMCILAIKSSVRISKTDTRVLLLIKLILGQSCWFQSLPLFVPFCSIAWRAISFFEIVNRLQVNRDPSARETKILYHRRLIDFCRKRSTSPAIHRGENILLLAKIRWIDTRSGSAWTVLQIVKQ